MKVILLSTIILVACTPSAHNLSTQSDKDIALPPLLSQPVRGQQGFLEVFVDGKGWVRQ